MSAPVRPEDLPPGVQALLRVHLDDSSLDPLDAVHTLALFIEDTLSVLEEAIRKDFDPAANMLVRAGHAAVAIQKLVEPFAERERNASS